MGKVHYLLVLLFLCIMGYVFVWQFQMATQTAVALTGVEMIQRLDLRLLEVHKLLKRFPDSDREFYILVLTKVEFPSRSPRFAIAAFRPGGAMAPARFQMVITSATSRTPQVWPMVYYGCDYQGHLPLKGKLMAHR